MTNHLIEKGTDEGNIRSMSILTAKSAIEALKKPSYSWLEVDSTDIYFPWGRQKEKYTTI